MANRGFTLIIAVLISSIVLSIGLSMFNIAIKQSILSSSAKESQAAFFAADSGIECAAYWEYKIPSAFTNAPYAASIWCNGTQITNPNLLHPPDVTITAADGLDPANLPWDEKSVFTLKLGADSAPCAVVTVLKNLTTPSTRIESRGFNTCVTSDPRRTERGIRVTQ